MKYLRIFSFLLVLLNNVSGQNQTFFHPLIESRIDSIFGSGLIIKTFHGVGANPLGFDNNQKEEIASKITITEIDSLLNMEDIRFNHFALHLKHKRRLENFSFNPSSDSLKLIIDSVTSMNRVVFGKTGYPHESFRANETSTIYALLSEQDALQLIYHPSPIIAFAAFKKLGTSRKHDKLFLEFFRKNLLNKTEIAEHDVCVSQHYQLLDLAGEYASKTFPDEIRKISIYEDNCYKETPRILTETNGNEEFKGRIEELVFRDSNFVALEALIKYKDTSHVEPLMKIYSDYIFSETKYSIKEKYGPFLYLYNSYGHLFRLVQKEWCIDQFLPLLLKFHERSITSMEKVKNKKILIKDFYSLLASYKNDIVLTSLIEAEKSGLLKPEDYRNHLQKYACEAFKEEIFRVTLSKDIREKKILNNLLVLDPKLTIELVKKELEQVVLKDFKIKGTACDCKTFRQLFPKIKTENFDLWFQLSKEIIEDGNIDFVKCLFRSKMEISNRTIPLVFSRIDAENDIYFLQSAYRLFRPYENRKNYYANEIEKIIRNKSELKEKGKILDENQKTKKLEEIFKYK